MSNFGASSLDDYLNDIKLPQNAAHFSQSISSISWAQPNVGNIFATTSWDGQLRVFSLEQGQFGATIAQKMSFMFGLPAMKCAWNDKHTQILVGLSDGSIKSYDLVNNMSIDIGKQDGAISSLHYVNGMNAVISTAYQRTIKIWQQGNSQPVMSLDAQSKVFASDFQFPTLVACTSAEKVLIIDILNQNSKALADSSDLGKGSQLQSIAINHKINTFGVGSFDGRANISSINKSVNNCYQQKAVITFKSNKQDQNGITVLYPVNSVGFNPRNDRWFMTAGAEGSIHFWDYQAKNKIKTFSYAGNPVCAAKVSPNGDFIAYALGNDWHVGNDGMGKWPVKLGVHSITQAEIKYKK